MTLQCSIPELGCIFTFFQSLSLIFISIFFIYCSINQIVTFLGVVLLFQVQLELIQGKGQCYSTISCLSVELRILAQQWQITPQALHCCDGKMNSPDHHKKILLGVQRTVFLSSSGNGWEVKIQMVRFQKNRKKNQTVCYAVREI